MKKEIADKWIKALRSGQYKQGLNYLNENNTNFCCLGVLCEIALSEGLNISKVGKLKCQPAPEESYIYEYNGDMQNLHISIIVWGDMHIDKSINEHTCIGELISMNDNQGCSFEEIAKFIEDNTDRI